jgi:hypothetical protein
MAQGPNPHEPAPANRKAPRGPAQFNLIQINSKSSANLQKKYLLIPRSKNYK